jgi:hypothetical protein
MSLILLCAARAAGRVGLDAVAQPHRAALERLGSDEPKRSPWRRQLTGVTCVLEDAGDAGQAVDAGVDDDADLVDEAGLQEGAVRAPAALEQ